MKLKFRISADCIATEDMLFILYFCSSIFLAVLSRLIDRSISEAVYALLFFGLVFINLIKQKPNHILKPSIVYSLVAALFLLSYLIHPEYESWFTHKYYGIVPALLNPKAGIWAFLAVWFINRDDKLFRNLKIVCILLILYNTLKYLAAIRRGYWIVVQVDEVISHQQYNLEFGYEMLFPTAFMGSYAFLKHKKLYYIFFAIGAYVILMGGSRGAIVWTIVMFPLMFPFLWKNMNKNKRVYLFIIFALLFIIIIYIFINFKMFIEALAALLSSIGLESRTIASFLDGSISDGNGREEIYAVAIDMIKSGGPLGWGVYGDRFVIANKIKWAIWGYSHNIFLELLVAFGYFTGTIACILLVKGVVGQYRNCDTEGRQIIFMTFLVTSCKLLLSNSFWYSSAFWALMALAIKWREKQKHVLSRL